MDNRRHFSCRFIAGAALVAILGTHVASAQTARSGGGNNAQLLQQMQQLASERTALQAENARMKKELADLTKERDTLKKSRSSGDDRAQAQASQAAVLRVTREKESLEGENQKLKERMQELVGKFRETATTLRDVEAERATFKQSLNENTAALATCTARNDALFKLNDEVLTRFEQQGVFSRMASAEPFTKLKRVQLENLLEDYRYRAEDQKVVPTASQH
jgi:chromosome segregation ATPase